jgi:ATP-dependent Clp protease ATP-binding subunit ClpA
MLSEVSARLLENSGITLHFSAEVTEKMAEEGFDPVYGARPLRRAIQRKVEDTLSQYLLSGTFREGDRVVAGVDAEGEITYEKEEASE